MNIVEGYVVNPENEWCNPFALGEPKYSTKVKVLTWIYFSEDPSRENNLLLSGFSFLFLR